MDLEDKIKAAIKARIMAGGYTSEQQLTNAVIAEGLTNTSGFIDDALGTFRGFKKSNPEPTVNYFDQADKNWDRLISTAKSSKKKRELQDMKPKMLGALLLRMKDEKIEPSNPKVTDIYEVIKKNLTNTWVQNGIDSVKDYFGPGDSMLPPSPAIKIPSAPAVMDEPTARKRLEDKGVKGADQDKWIKRYREEGVVK